MEDKKTLSPEQQARRKMAKSMARTLFRVEFNAANPDASKDARAAAWKDAQQDKTKSMLNALKAFEREGYVITAPAESS